MNVRPSQWKHQLGRQLRTRSQRSKPNPKRKRLRERTALPQTHKTRRKVKQTDAHIHVIRIIKMCNVISLIDLLWLITVKVKNVLIVFGTEILCFNVSPLMTGRCSHIVCIQSLTKAPYNMQLIYCCFIL